MKAGARRGGGSWLSCVLREWGSRWYEREKRERGAVSESGEPR